MKQMSDLKPISRLTLILSETHLSRIKIIVGKEASFKDLQALIRYQILRIPKMPPNKTVSYKFEPNSNQLSYFIDSFRTSMSGAKFGAKYDSKMEKSVAEVQERIAETQ